MASKRKKKEPNWRLIGMIVVPIVVAVIGLIPTILDRLGDTPSGPAIYDFAACASPCNGSNATTVFEEPGIKKIYAQWSYRNIPIGATYVRAWSRNGQEWVRYVCTWPGPTNGKNLVNLTEPGGLRSGVWEMTITVNGAVLLREEIQLDGEHSYWDPIGTVTGCG